MMIFFVLLLAIVTGYSWWRWRKAEKQLKILAGKKKSTEVRTGQIVENFAPFLPDFGHDPKSAHFLGMPVDFVIFEETGITFKEIKSGGARLSPKQRLIKQLIEDGKVYWEEMRIDDTGTT